MKAPRKRVRAKQRRLSPQDRRREFVAKATEFFAEEGFGGGPAHVVQEGGQDHGLSVDRVVGGEGREFLLQDEPEGDAAEAVVQGAFAAVVFDVVVGGGDEWVGRDGDLGDGEGWEWG